MKESEWVTQTKLISFSRTHDTEGKKNHKQETGRMKSLIGYDGWSRDATTLTTLSSGNTWHTCSKRGQTNDHPENRTQNSFSSPPVERYSSDEDAIAKRFPSSTEKTVSLSVSVKVRKKQSAIQRDNNGYNEDRKEGSMCDKVNAFKREYCIRGERRKRVHEFLELLSLSLCVWGGDAVLTFTFTRHQGVVQSRKTNTLSLPLPHTGAAKEVKAEKNDCTFCVNKSHIISVWSCVRCANIPFAHPLNDSMSRGNTVREMARMESR